MFKNYFKIAYRNMFKNKLNSFISIMGLTIGIACFILIMLWVQDELSFDSFHKNANNIYRVTWKNNDMEKFSVLTPPVLAKVIGDEIPEIKNSSRVTSIPQKSQFTYKQQCIDAHTTFVDKSFFSMFSFESLNGDIKSALDEQFSIVLTRRLADKLFHNEDPVGKVISYQFLNNKEYDLVVKGVIKNIVKNSHIQTESFISFNFLKVVMPLSDWGNHCTSLYILSEKTKAIEDLNLKIAGCMSKNFDKMEAKGLIVALQPLKKIHLHSDFQGDFTEHGNIKYVYFFSIIAIFILVIACINFMNITTAGSMKRSLEIGVRKVVGANKKQIIHQFMSEIILMTLISFIVSILLVEISLPYFCKWANKNLYINYASINFIFSAISIIAITTFIAASYPAFFLSSLSPIKILKKNIIKSSRGNLFRNVLVSFQFALSIIIIIASIVVIQQLNYIQNAKLGYDKDNLLLLRMRGEVTNQYKNLKRDLLQQSDIVSVTANNFITSDIRQGTSSIQWESQSVNDRVSMQIQRVDCDFIKTYKIDLIAGRFFSKSRTSDLNKSYVINETAMKAMGMKSAVDKKFSLWGQQGKIIGVIKDFHFKSLHNKIEPVVLWLNTTRNFSGFKYLTLRVKSNSIFNTIKVVKSIYKKHSPDYPFEYSFFDESLGKLYKSEKRLSKIFNFFTLLAIFISCLGLFALVAFLVEQKTKEIGIRKVLGSTVGNILGLLLKSFMKWIIIANIIAWPIAYYAMNKWLTGFAYRIDMTIFPFLLSGILALIIAMVTVSFQSIKAARANPVESLKYE